MADSTYAVKVSDEVKERLQKLIEESGQSSKDFFVDMVSQFELANTKRQAPILAADIDELIKLTTRINNIFINVGERIVSFQDTCRREAEFETNKKESLISLLQQQVESLERDAAQNKSYEKENETLKIESNEAQRSAEKLRQENEKLKNLLAEKEKMIQNMQTSQAAKLDELAQKYFEDTERQKEKFELEKDRALLVQREQYNRELDEAREVYQDKINQLLQISIKPKKETQKKGEASLENQ